VACWHLRARRRRRSPDWTVPTAARTRPRVGAAERDGCVHVFRTHGTPPERRTRIGQSALQCVPPLGPIEDNVDLLLGWDSAARVLAVERVVGRGLLRMPTASRSLPRSFLIVTVNSILVYDSFVLGWQVQFCE
jgi:hypothetical protein